MKLWQTKTCTSMKVYRCITCSEGEWMLHFRHVPRIPQFLAFDPWDVWVSGSDGFGSETSGVFSSSAQGFQWGIQCGEKNMYTYIMNILKHSKTVLHIINWQDIHYDHADYAYDSHTIWTWPSLAIIAKQVRIHSNGHSLEPWNLEIRKCWFLHNFMAQMSALSVLCPNSQNIPKVKRMPQLSWR